MRHMKRLRRYNKAINTNKKYVLSLSIFEI